MTVLWSLSCDALKLLTITSHMLLSAALAFSRTVFSQAPTSSDGLGENVSLNFAGLILLNDTLFIVGFYTIL